MNQTDVISEQCVSEQGALVSFVNAMKKHRIEKGVRLNKLSKNIVTFCSITKIMDKERQVEINFANWP